MRYRVGVVVNAKQDEVVRDAIMNTYGRDRQNKRDEKLDHNVIQQVKKEKM